MEIFPNSYVQKKSIKRSQEMWSRGVKLKSRDYSSSMIIMGLNGKLCPNKCQQGNPSYNLDQLIT